MRWEEASGQATLYTWSVVHRNDLPPFGERSPYVAAVVDLAEGPRMMTEVVERDWRRSCGSGWGWRSLLGTGARVPSPGRVVQRYGFNRAESISMSGSPAPSQPELPVMDCGWRHGARTPTPTSTRGCAG